MIVYKTDGEESIYFSRAGQESTSNLEVLNEDIASFLIQRAVASGMPDILFGFADTAAIATVTYDGIRLDSAISVACALNAASIASLSKGLSTSYLTSYNTASSFLRKLTFELVAFLKERKYHAISSEDPIMETSMETSAEGRDLNEGAAIASTNRTFAAHAGLGWVGKNGLIVTKHFGPAVILATVFTDAPLECATEVFLSRCGRCKECAEACPTSAINVSKPASLDNIESMIDVERCRKECHARTTERFGEPMDLCGICIYACPYTKSYLSRKGYPYE